MLCPTAPSLPWVAWASLPHLRRYYTPLRLPSVPLGSLRLSLASRYLACFHSSWSPSRARDHGESSQDPARAFGHPVPHSGYLVKETGGSPKFPSSPCGDMPRSQTPVVSCALAMARPGLLQTPPTPVLRLCIIKPTGLPRPSREGYRCFFEGLTG